jgi:hypothetical protein
LIFLIITEQFKLFQQSRSWADGAEIPAPLRRCGLDERDSKNLFLIRENEVGFQPDMRRRRKRSFTSQYWLTFATSRTSQRRSPRRAAWLFWASPDKLTPVDKDYLHQLIHSSDALAPIYKFSQDFVNMFSDQAVDQLNRWLFAVEQFEFKIFKNFAISIRKDIEAVKTALMYAWSNGQTEGQANRLDGEACFIVRLFFW